MAALKDAVSNVTLTTGQGSGVNIGLTVGASATFLVIGIEQDAATPGAPNWDSAGTNQLMTLIGTAITNGTSSPTMTLALYGLVNPTPGAKLVKLNGSSNGAAYCSGISFTGTDTSSVAAVVEGYATNQSASTTITVSSGIAIPTGDMAVTFYNDVQGYSNAFTPGSNPGDGGTAIGKNEGGTTNMAAEYYSGAGATISSSAATPSFGSNSFVAAIVGIKAAGAAAASTGTRAPMFAPSLGPQFNRLFKPLLAFTAATVNASPTLVGVAGVGVAGTIIANPAGLLIGVAGTGSAGSLAPSVATGGLAQAAGTGTVGSIVSSVATGALAQAIGTGVAGSLFGSVSGTITGAVGVGVAGVFTPSVSITLGAASGTGVAGIIGSLDVAGLVGVAGTGVAQGIVPEVDAFLSGAVGIGQAGAFSFSGTGSGILTGATGTGVAGSLTASIQAFLSGAAGTGVAGTFTPTVSSTLGAAVGTGVAGTFTTTASGNTTLAQASGTGIAQSITASIGGFFAGGVGIGVAGSLAAQVAVNFSGVIGTGVAGGVSGQVSGGTLNVGVIGVAGIGIAGIITADNGVVQAVGGGNGGSRKVREKKKQPVEFKPVPRKGTFPKGYLPEAAPDVAPASQPAPIERVHYELPEAPLAPMLRPQLVPSIDDLSPFGAKVDEPAPEQDADLDQAEPESEAATEPQEAAAAPEQAPAEPPLDVDAIVEAGLEEARQAKARETELQEKIAAEVARQVAAAVARLKPQIEADLLARLKAEADAKEKAEAARIAKAKDDARQLAEEIARREAEAKAEEEANLKEAERMLEAHIEQENKIRETVSDMIADIIASIQHDLT